MDMLPVVLIYAHNNLSTLPELLRLLPAGAPLIVVDDASTDGSAELLRDAASTGKIELLVRDGKPDRVAALNAGFAHAAQRFPCRDILRLHADTLPWPPEGERPGAFVRHLHETLTGLPHCGVLGVRLVYADGRILSEGRTTVCGLGLAAPDRERRHLAPDNPTQLFGPTPQTDSVSGLCVLYRHSALQAVQALTPEKTPLDPAYGPHGLEDDDLCFAARLCGFEVRVVPWLRAVHLGIAPPPEGAQAPVLQQFLRRERELAEAQSEYWKQKWGWDPLLPDMNEIRRRYGHSRVCWQISDRWASTDPFPAVDLCMVTWNGERVLQRCLESLAATDYPADKLVLHILDNASTDATSAILRNFSVRCPFPVHITRQAVNTGAVVGLNWVFMQGSNPLVAKLDDDIIVPPHWLRHLTLVFASRPYAGVVGPCIVDDSPQRRVQCADFSYYPTPFCHEGEPEDIQWPGMARVTHVRGCCNLYRRSVFARCGLLDISYSPSQWDDPDHHLSLLHAGYEVIYSGQVHVAHKCLTGTLPTPAAQASSAINKAKMLAKWGPDSPELLECALLLSREGRFLHNNTPPPPVHEASEPLASPDPELVRQLGERCAALWPGDDDLTPALSGMGTQLRHAARTSLEQGRVKQALGELRTAVCCGIADTRLPATLSAFADILEQSGVPAPLQRWLADVLETGPSPLFAEAPAVFPSIPPAFPQDATACVRFRVPHAHRYDAPLRALLEVYADALRAEGVCVELDCCAGETDAPAAVTHLWTLDNPHETLNQLAWLRQHHKSAVLTPLWRPAAHALWAERLVEQLRAGELTGLIDPPQPQEGDTPLLRRMALGLATVLPCSAAEGRLLQLPELTRQLSLPPQTVPPLPLPPLSLPSCGPEAFQAETGLKDFLLAVAPFHPQSNQAALLTGLARARLNLPVVLVGKAQDPWYLRACRRLAPAALFVDEMDDDLLASAFAGARLVALPSLAPCGHVPSRTAVTARQLGKPVVAASGSAESALPGVFACNPLSPDHVGAALHLALQAGASTPPKEEIPPAQILLQVYATLRNPQE